MALQMQLQCSVVGRGSRLSLYCNSTLELCRLPKGRNVRCRLSGDLRVSGEDLRKGLGVGTTLKDSGPCVRTPERIARCSSDSSGSGEVEAVDRGTRSLLEPQLGELIQPCEAVTSSDSRMRGFSEILRAFFSLGGDCTSLCAPTESQGIWRKFSAALLCSCAVVTPGLALSSPVPAAQSMPASDFVAAAVTLAGALGILQFFDELAKRNLLDKKLSRKLCHILSGLVFMLFWPFFSSAPLAKYLAAFAPAANGLRMVGLGLGLWRNEALVKAISREGSQRELLQGPLYYAITITIATLCFWRNSPVGACAVATLCAGDGFADIVGRKYGTHKLPYNNSKSYIGSVAFFAMASLASMGYVAYFSAFGFFTSTAKTYFATLGVALASAIVESLPLPLDDNFTVPFTAIGVGMLILPF